MDKKKEYMVRYLGKYKKETEKSPSHITTLILSEDDIDYLINNLKAVDKLENEIKTMIIERLTETCNEINNLKQEKARQETLQECYINNTRMANIINPLNLKMYRFDRGLY